MLYGVLMGYIGFFIYHHPYDRGEEKRTVGWAFFFKKTRVFLTLTIPQSVTDKPILHAGSIKSDMNSIILIMKQSRHSIDCQRIK
jgi:hypothetical protein